MNEVKAQNSGYIIRAKQALTMTGWDDKPELNPESADTVYARDRHLLGLIEDAAICVQDDTIVEVAPFAECTRKEWPVRHTVNVAMPAWIECHTHSLFAGNRAGEFGLRNAGVPYVEILESGGGILSTVHATRNATDHALIASLVDRLAAFRERGIATVEVKTGYGLSTNEELRHLRLIESASALANVDVIPTFLGAHAIPKERRGDPERYVDEVVNEMLPRVAEEGMAQFCDVFCDRGAFTVQQSRRVLLAAKSLGLDLRIHAEEIVHTGGAVMAAELGAASVDHCDHIDAVGVKALVENDCVATFLPGVTVFLDLEARPPARAIVDAGGRIALSTDFNPGSAHTQDLALMTTLGCTMLKLTPGETLYAVTRGAAHSLRLGDRGSLAPGQRADIIAFEFEDFTQIPYTMGAQTRPLWVAESHS